MKNKTIKSVVENLCQNFNKPIIQKTFLEEWIMQFEPNERQTSIELIRAIDYNSYPVILKKLYTMHKMLIQSLKNNDFDVENFKDVDFSWAYDCKSGSLISYFYRKVNKIRNICFKSIETLNTTAKDENKKRAIVILDDYTGTGDQFLSEFYARNPENRATLNSYKKIYFMPITANDIAAKKFKMLKQGKTKEVVDIILKEFALNHTDGLLFQALSSVQNNKLELINYNVEYPLLSEENKIFSKESKEKIERFLLKYNCGNPFGMGNAQGHTTFFYSAPNSMPDILWNSKMKDLGLLPLFERINDISIYPMAANIPIEEQVW